MDVNPGLVLVFMSILLIYFYKYMKQTYTIFKSLGIPGPSPVWIFGNVLEFKDKNVLSVFDEWKKTYGKVYGFYEGFKASIVINDPDIARDILNRHFDNFHARTSYRPFTYFYDSMRLIEITGEHWKHQRAAVNKMLNSSGNLSQASEKMFQATKSMINSLEPERELSPDELNIAKFVDSYVVDAAARVVLNMDDDDIKRYRKDIYNYFRLSNWSASAENEAAGLARLFPTLTPLMKLSDKEHKKSYEKVVEIIRQNITSISESQNNNTMKSEDHVSLLSFLLSSNVLSRDIDGSLVRRDMNTDEIISHVFSLLSEMYSTTTAAIQFILYELSLHSEVQEKLYEEISRCCGQGENFDLLKSEKMEYFDMVFYESLRLHPIAPGLSRVCTQGCKIRDVTFKEGMVVRVMTSTLYRDDTYYPQPDVFDPERFSKEKRETRHQYSFLPFGQGPRMCPGQKMALTEVRYAIISIIKSYIISTTSNTEIPLKEALRPSLTPANGVTVKLTPRS